MGGSKAGSGGYDRSVVQYDTLSNTWTTLDPLSADRDYPVTPSNAYDGVFYLLGGQATGPTTVTSSYRGTVVVNNPPNAPTLTGPAEGGKIDRSSTQRFSWTFSDPDPGDTQSAYAVRYRRAGTADPWTDTGWKASPSSWHDFPPGTFPVGDYEWQAATKDTRGLAGPYSASGFFTVGEAPPAPSITAPANGATIATPTSEVTWSTPDQDAYQLQVLDGATVVYDTGTVPSAGARSLVVAFPESGTTRTVRVRVLFAGLWSPWAAVTVTVAYTTPAVPVLTVTADDEAGSIHVGIAHPAPVGDQPVVVSHDVHVREVGTTGPGIRLAAEITGNHTWWLPAAGIGYEFRVKATGVTGATAWSAWTA